MGGCTQPQRVGWYLEHPAPGGGTGQAPIGGKWSLPQNHSTQSLHESLSRGSLKKSSLQVRAGYKKQTFLKDISLAGQGHRGWEAGSSGSPGDG